MKAIFCITALLVSAVSFSQEPCGIDIVENKRLQSNPALQQAKEQWLEQVNNEQQVEHVNRALYQIPVVFHIMHQFGTENISRSQIYDCLRILNEDFSRLNADSVDTRTIFKPLASNMDIEFILANKDPNGNCTDGITRTYCPITYGANDDVKYQVNGGKNAWPTDKYLNIWVVGSIKLDENATGTVLGYAYFPYSAGQSYYGIVMHNKYTGTIGTSSSDGRTISHEAGHCFGLAHTFNNGCGNNCNNSGDNVCDTPPTPNATYGCNFVQNNCSNDMNGTGSAFTSDVVDQIENYMSYDACQNMFTKGQRNRAHASITNTNLSNMVTASNASYTGIDNVAIVCVPEVDFYAQNTSICVGNSVQLVDYTVNSEPTTSVYTFQSVDTVFTVSGVNPLVQINKAGLYTVTLDAANSAGTASKVRNQYITVFDANSSNIQPFIDGLDNGPLSSGRWGKLTKGEAGFNGFEENTSVGLTNGSCIYVNNAQAMYSGFKSELLSGVYKLQTIPNPALTFKTAFARKNNANTDILRVYASSNCNPVWSIIYVSNSDNLVSASNQTSAFTPNMSDWKTHSITIPNTYANSNSTRFKFEFTGKGGNNFYIEDINILAYADLEVSEQMSEVELFPNPGATFNLKSENIIDEVSILSLDGKKVYNAQPKANEWSFQQAENLAKGVYYIQIKCGTLSQVKKWIKF